MMRTIILPGEPISQKRPRIFGKGAMDPCWQAKEQHRSYIRDKYPHFDLLTTAISVTFIYLFEYPKSMSKNKRYIHFKETRPDIDNLNKYIMDMGNGVLWCDDSIIVNEDSAKMYGDKDLTILHIRHVDASNLTRVLEKMKV